MGDTLADIKTTFLNGIIKEEVYVKQPLGVETHDRQTHVCKLKKALYEFRRHPWDNTYMMSLMKILTFATRLKMKAYIG